MKANLRLETLTAMVNLKENKSAKNLKLTFSYYLTTCIGYTDLIVPGYSASTVYIFTYAP